MPLICPLTVGLATTATCLATSSVFATFRRGVVASALSTKVLSFSLSCAIGVPTQPGLTLLTLALGAMETISFLRVGVRPYI